MYFSKIEDSIYLAIDTGINDIIITGDFNFNMLHAQTSTKIRSLCEEISLTQVITEPTHYDFTKDSASLIDIILVSNPAHLISSGVGDPFLQQNVKFHCPIFGLLNFTKPTRNSFTRRIWRYDHGDYNLFRQNIISTDRNEIKHDNINIYAKQFTNKLMNLAELCIPNKIITIRPADPPWITTHIKRLIRRRKRAYRVAKRTQNPHDWNKFKQLRNKATAAIRESKQAMNDRLADKLKSSDLSSKQWWSILKSFISPTSNSTIPPLEKNGTVYANDTEKANVLNDFFKHQTLLNDDNVELPDIIPYPVHENLSSISLTPDEVETTLKSLPVGKATGPDEISNRMLKEISREIAAPITDFFNHSLNTGEVPDSFKESHIVPVPKGGDPSDVGNHRPISLLSNINKTLERLVFKYLFNHFRDNNIITPFQSGFTPGDSPVNQLTYLYNTFCQALDSEKEVRVVFCDILKAFDRVWHRGLIHKLRAAGISGRQLKWFVSYLENRKQRVVLPGGKSNWEYIHAGVPQGSILGPLLFLLYINDIVNEIGSNIRLFADDTSLFIIVENPYEAAMVLNSDLLKISRWANLWLVKFNPNKNEVMLFTRKFDIQDHPPVIMMDQQIQDAQFHKHLGVYFSSDCSWHHHINYIKQKAWTRINVMRKLKFILDRKSLETIYITFIRPLLEYADIIWDNCSDQEKKDLEKLQTEAARIATGATKLVSIEKLYDEVCWERLETRRWKHKLVLFHKMYHTLAPQYLSTLVPPLVQDISRYNLRNANNLQTIHARTTQYYESFLPSVVRDWNSLPCTDRDVDTTESFKNRLNQNRVYVPKYYYTGKRRPQVLHTRLRTRCSALNSDLQSKNIIASPLCTCTMRVAETAYHYFLSCPLYRDKRSQLTYTISQYTTVTLGVILSGDSTLPLSANVAIFEAVQKYITDTKRFDTN